MNGSGPTGDNAVGHTNIKASGACNSLPPDNGGGPIVVHCSAGNMQGDFDIKVLGSFSINNPRLPLKKVGLVLNGVC